MRKYICTYSVHLSLLSVHVKFHTALVQFSFDRWTMLETEVENQSQSLLKVLKFSSSLNYCNIQIYLKIRHDMFVIN